MWEAKYQPCRKPDVILSQAYKASQHVVSLDHSECYPVIYPDVYFTAQRQTEMNVRFGDSVKARASPHGPEQSVSRWRHHLTLSIGNARSIHDGLRVDVTAVARSKMGAEVQDTTSPTVQIFRRRNVDSVQIETLIVQISHEVRVTGKKLNLGRLLGCRNDREEQNQGKQRTNLLHHQFLQVYVTVRQSPFTPIGGACLP